MWGRWHAARTAILVALASIALLGPTVRGASTDSAPLDDAYALCPTRVVSAFADDALAGFVRSRTFGSVYVGTDIDWARDPIGHPTWLTELNSLQWLDSSIARGTPADIARVRAVLLDWLADNPRSAPSTSWAWIDRVAAMRSRTLLCAGRHFSSQAWWSRAIVAHGNFLADDGPYRYWNHGLDEDISLAWLGCARQRTDWVTKAKTRGTENVRRTVDGQGADVQQAIAYAKYTRTQAGLLARTIALCDRTALPTDRIKKLDDFLAHATRPDQRFEQLGDTYQQVWRPEQPPTATAAVYRGGYVFRRSSWRPPASYYTLRYGPSLDYHGHADHTSLTYFRDGREWLIDAGMIGYKIGPYRNWVESAPAHNVVVVHGAGEPLNVATLLTSWRIGDRSESYAFTDTPYAGVRRDRKVLHVDGANEFFVVVDRLTDSRPVPDATYEQLWHLPQGVKVEQRGPNAVRVRSADGLRTFHIVQAWAGTTTTVTASVPPAAIQGWRSRSFEERIAAPTIVRTQRGASAWYVTLLVDTSHDRPVFATFVRAGGRTVLRVGIGTTRHDIVVDEPLLRGA